MIATGRRLERLQALQAELGGSDHVHIVQLDVRNRAATECFISALPAAWQEISILVNNAGLAVGLEPAASASLDDWDAMVQTNVQVRTMKSVFQQRWYCAYESGAGSLSSFIFSSARVRCYQGLMYMTRAVLPGFVARNKGTRLPAEAIPLSG